MRWDLFCRVVDNFGDIGLCWRLARELVARGEQVRLVVDDSSALAWMAPAGASGVEVRSWPAPGAPFDPADVVVEAFGCDPPAACVQAMVERAQQGVAPAWINLEHLSAEAYVERSHGLPSPQLNGLKKWFFYPGFSRRTGGLLREQGLADLRCAFDRVAWLAGLGLQLRPGERVVSLFCYDNLALPSLLEQLAREPTLLLLTPGPAQRQVPQSVPGLRLARLPWLSQIDFDHLLWSCDLNFVRGEDSLVRAIWAGAPFVWQAYPQDDGAHLHKLQALLERLALPDDAAALWRAWNGMPVPAAFARALPPAPAWRDAARDLRADLCAQDGLAEQLIAFASGKARAP